MEAFIFQFCLYLLFKSIIFIVRYPVRNKNLILPYFTIKSIQLALNLIVIHVNC